MALFNDCVFGRRFLLERGEEEAAKKKAIQVALKVMFRLRKEKPDKNLKVKIASIDELKQSGFKEWWEAGNKWV